MSFIHLDKSVVTFHFKEILEDGYVGGPLTLVSLGALLFGPKLLAKTQSESASPYRPGMSLSAWVRQQQAAQHTPERPHLTMADRAPDADRMAA